MRARSDQPLFCELQRARLTACSMRAQQSAYATFDEDFADG
jgi:hypothetical protein